MAHSIITQLVGQIPSSLNREKFWLALQAERLDSNAIRQDVHRFILERFIPKVVGCAVLGGVGLVAAIAGTIVTWVSNSPISWVVGGAGFIGFVTASEIWHPLCQSDVWLEQWDYFGEDILL